MSRLFNPVDLMNANLEANATKREPLPVGETLAQIIEQKMVEGVAGAQAKNPGAPWTRLDSKLEITDPKYLSGVPGQPAKVVTTLGIMLDMEAGQIKSGPNTNIRLGKLRAACGTNGKPINAMNGCYIRIAIGHKTHPTKPVDEDGNAVILDEIVSYTKA